MREHGARRVRENDRLFTKDLLQQTGYL